MLSRRDVILGAAAAGVAALVRDTVLADASQPATPVRFDVPAGACDCHTHIFGDPRRFPFARERVYTPQPASIEEMRRLHRALHMSRVVIVQPSVYGTDNACTLDAIKQLGAGARGVAVIDDKTSDTALDEMGRAGIRGIRINLETAGQTDPAVGGQRLRAAIGRVKDRNWHIQVYTRLSVIDRLADQISASPVPIVIDHFGGAQASLGIRQPGFEPLVNLVRAGSAYVKISGAYNLPYGILASANYDIRSGMPQARQVVLTGGTTIRSITLNVEPLGTFGLPRTHELDVRLAKKFGFGGSRALELRADIYNALNKGTVRAWNLQSGANYLRPSTILFPRIVQAGATLTF